jgi:hypothetical protein
VKGVDKESQGFGYLRQKFPNISDAKLKEWIFIRPQIKQLFEDQDFNPKLNSTPRRTWKASENACRNFLRKEKEENYSAIVQEPISSHSGMGCNMSSKFLCLHSHSDFFPENIGSISDEHGERFHPDISLTEKRYSGKWSPNKLADYCYSLIGETHAGESKRHKKTKSMFNKLFSSSDTVYRDTLTVYVVIKNQNITFFLLQT